jgi:DNA polymerase III subunit delta
MRKNVYIFSGESYMVRRSLTNLRQSLDITYPEMNVSEYKTMPKADEIIESCCSVPFMSPCRLVIVSDCTVLTSKGSAEEAKKIAAYLGRMPETTVLALCTGEPTDKRRALYQEVKKTGEVVEFGEPERSDCISFVIKTAKEQGSSINSKAASDLADLAGRDYYSLENETAKLAAFCGYKEITPAHVAECVSKSLEYNIFELHGYLINKQAGKAQELLEDILREERPEGLVGLIARKIRDMYKVRTMLDSGFSFGKIAGTMNISSYVAEIISRECRSFTGQELRSGLIALADLDYAIKSGEADASLKLPKTLFKIYKLI